MKKLLALLALTAFLFTTIAAQEDDALDWDIDSLFDELPSETSPEEDSGNLSSSALGSVKQRGFIFDAAYKFHGALVPGWDKSLLDFNGEEVFSWGPGGKISAAFSLDAQISEVFRVLTVFSFSIPNFKFTLGDFFFDYNLLNKAFIRTGKYEHSWGISPNFNFTNLLSRVPVGKKDYGTSYVFKVDIPIGVGGIQALALTRSNLLEGIYPEWDDVGYGGKYNLALRKADFDIGVFYQENMALRSFISIKTTILNTELYNEWLVAVNTKNNAASYAANIGFARNFFEEKLTLNGEFFYNGEKDTEFYRKETDLLGEDILPFIESYTIAFNMLYRFSGKGSPRIFTKVLYAPLQSSAQVVPGIRLTPLSNMEIYLAFQMALGNKSGYYYQNTADPFKRPFSIMLLVTLSGGVRAGYTY